MGEGHLQGKTEFGGDSSKAGTSEPNDFVTGPRHPSRFPLWCSTPELKGCHPLLFGLQGLRPFKVRRGTRGPNWGSKGSCRDCTQPPLGVGRLRALPFPLGTPTWGHTHPRGTLFLHSHMAESPNPVSPNCQLPTPIGSKCNPMGCRDGDLLSPHLTLPPKEGERCPQHGNSCCSRAVGPGEEVQVSTGGLVLPIPLGLQVWPGTSCAGHWPGFSSGVPPE